MKGWIEGEWGKTAKNRRARYYRITRAGEKQLDEALQRYRRVTTAIARIVQSA